jgi:ribonuclease HI/probable phosphoglycerate mutase
MAPRKATQAPLFAGEGKTAPRSRTRTDRASALSKVAAGGEAGFPHPAKRYLVYADGASRGNPGPASIGAAVFDERGQEVARVSRRIGYGTNNEAEYQAAIAGLEAALGLGGAHVELRMDSQLIVRQLEFRYKVRNARLQPFFNRILELKRQFASFAVRHIPREQNARADELANHALDRLEGDDD